MRGELDWDHAMQALYERGDMEHNIRREDEVLEAAECNARQCQQCAQVTLGACPLK